MSKTPKSIERRELETQINKQIADKIKAVRIKKGLYMKNVVSHPMCNITETQYRNQEHGKVNFTISDLLVIFHSLKQNMQLNFYADELKFEINVLKPEKQTDIQPKIQTKQLSLWDKITNKFTKE